MLNMTGVSLPRAVKRPKLDLAPQSIDDVLGEYIVTRCLAFVPVRELWRAAAVCKSWAALVSSPHLLAERRRIGISERK